MMFQDVVNIQSGARNGWFLIETSMRTMPVVSVHPRFEVGKTMRGILVDARVGPFADDGLDEAFGFAVGAGRVEAGAFVFDPLSAGSEQRRDGSGNKSRCR